MAVLQITSEEQLEHQLATLGVRNPHTFVVEVSAHLGKILLNSATTLDAGVLTLRLPKGDVDVAARLMSRPGAKQAEVRVHWHLSDSIPIHGNN